MPEGEKKPRKKPDRQKGGFALVEVLDEGKTLRVLAADLAGQKEARDHLVHLIQTEEVKADGSQTFGIIQVKASDLTPKAETTVKVNF